MRLLLCYNFHLGCMHKVAEPNVPLAPANILEAPPAPPLALWDLPLLPLPNFKMEPISPGLLLVGILPQPAILVIELSSLTAPMIVAASPLYLEYHLGVTLTHEEDPFEELSTASCTLQVAESSHHAPRVEVLSRHPCIIRTPSVSRRRGARGCNCCESQCS